MAASSKSDGLFMSNLRRPYESTAVISSNILGIRRSLRLQNETPWNKEFIFDCEELAYSFRAIPGKEKT